MGLWFSKIDRPQELSAHAVRAAVIGYVLNDPAFFAALRKDPESAVASRFRNNPYRVRVVIEQHDELALLLPCRTEELARMLAATSMKLAAGLPTKGQVDAAIVQKAWNDASFLARLRTDPRGTLETVLKEYAAGLSVPSSKTVRLYEEQPGECLIIIPAGIRARTQSSSAGAENSPGDGTIVLPCRSLTVLRSARGDGQQSPTPKESKP
jgi:hypothetical protein